MNYPSRGRMALDFIVEDCSRPPTPSPPSSVSTEGVISRPSSVPPPAQGILNLARAAEIAEARDFATAEAPFSPVSTNSSASSSLDDQLHRLNKAPANSRRPRMPLHRLPVAQPEALRTPSVAVSPAQRSGGSRTHLCPLCGEVFTQKVRFLHHLFQTHGMRTYDAKLILPCARCDSAFLRNTDRTKHDSCVHLKLRPHRCDTPDCSSSFFFAKDLHKHRSTVHLRHKPFPCTICNKAFGKREHMTSHVKRVHQRLRPFKCDVCGIRLASKYNLQGHLKTAAHAAAETATRSALQRAAETRGVV